MKRTLIFLILCLFVIVGCSNNDAADGSNADKLKEKIDGVPEEVQDNIKVGVIRNLPSDDHTKQFLDGAKKEGESFGFQVDTFISDGDDARFQDLVSQAIQKQYDGLIISHGDASYSYDMITPAIEKDIEVVTFDTIAEKDGQVLEGITSTQQNDELLAEMSLDKVIENSDGDEPPKVLKITIGGIPPLDNRDEVYKQYEEEGKIETVDTVGPQSMDNVQGDVESAVTASLNKYGEGEIDVVWAAWDELAKGAYTALRNKDSDLKLVSIDISNQDINFMTEDDSKWVSTAAVDPYLIGVMNMRLLAKKIAGEDAPETYQLEPNVIDQSNLDSDTTMDDLNEIIDGWGVSDDFNEDWMDKLRDN